MIGSRITALVLIAAALAIALPAAAGPKGQSGNKGQGKGVMMLKIPGINQIGGAKTRPVVSGDSQEDDGVLRILDAARDGTGRVRAGTGLPPGLAKRLTLPPGLAKMGQLPPGLAKGHGTPPGLAKMGQLPPGLSQ